MMPASIRVQCACGNAMEFSRSKEGHRVTCPNCSAVNVVGAGVKILQSDRSCPFCAEPIQMAAVKCRHCGEFVDGRARVAPPAGAPKDEKGIGILILGILSIKLGPCSIILGPLAWILGNSHIRDCEARGIKPNGMVKAGKICGIIGTVLWVGFIAIYAVFFLALGAHR